MIPIHTIASFAKPQPDTVAAIFLLRKYGEDAFPGIARAKLELWMELPPGTTAQELEQNGYILIDLGNGQFDHHRHLIDGRPTKCASEIVAEYLGVSQDPSLRKLLAYARRDDLEGKGTISADPLDRAFGLSGLLSNLNRTYSQDLVVVIEMVHAMFVAHHAEEENRTKILPAEWKELSADGRADQWGLNTALGRARVVQVPSDNPGMAGFLKAYHHFDIVVVRRSTGHVSIITNQSKRVDLGPVMAHIRALEIRRSDPQAFVVNDLSQPGRIDEVPWWWYDTAANTLQNGGLRPDGVISTSLSYQEVNRALYDGLFVPETQEQ